MRRTQLPSLGGSYRYKPKVPLCSEQTKKHLGGTQMPRGQGGFGGGGLQNEKTTCRHSDQEEELRKQTDKRSRKKKKMHSLKKM